MKAVILRFPQTQPEGRRRTPKGISYRGLASDQKTTRVGRLMRAGGLVLSVAALLDGGTAHLQAQAPAGSRLAILRSDGAEAVYTNITEAFQALRDGEELRISGRWTVAPGVEEYGPPFNAALVLSNLHNIRITGLQGAEIHALTHGNVVLFQELTDATISGLTFRGAGSDAGDARFFALALMYGTNRNVRFVRNRFLDSGEHAIANLHGPRNVFDSVVEDNCFANIGNRRHQTLGADGACVAISGRNNRVVNNQFKSVLRAVEVEGWWGFGYNCLIANNIVEGLWDNPHAMAFLVLASSGDENDFRRITIANNIVEGAGRQNTYGVYVTGGAEIAIQNNQFHNLLYGVSVTSGHCPLHNIQISGNTIDSTAHAAISVTPYQLANYNVNQVYIGGNNIRNAGHYGILAGASDMRVVNNSVVDCRGTGLALYGRTNDPSTNVFAAQNLLTSTRNAMWISPAVTGAVLRDNTATSYLEGCLIDEGTRTDTSLAFNGGGAVRLGTTANVAVGDVLPHSQLHLQGSLAFKAVRTTQDLTLTEQYYVVLADASLGNVTITLPSATGIAGRVYMVKRVNPEPSVVVVQTVPGQTIEGLPVFPLRSMEFIQVISDGANWFVLGG